MNKKILILLGVVAVLGLAWAGWKYSQSRGGDGTSTPGGEEGSATEPMACPIGSYWNYGEVQYRITGYENQSVGGSTRRLCCGTWEDPTNNEEMKYCYDSTGNESDYFVAWVSNAETGGEMRRSMESYKQGEQSCLKIYDAQENVLAESCQ